MKLFIMILLFSSVGYANVPMLFDDHGVLIEPDVVLLQQGLKEYKKGKIESSLQQLKRSAKFGNDAAKYLIGLIQLEDSHAINARAWLMLMKKPIFESQSVLTKLNKKLSAGEMALSDQKLIQLKNIYNDDISYQARKKWAKRVRTTGTNIAGLSGTSTRNLSVISGGEMSQIGGPGNTLGGTSSYQVNSFNANKQVRKFVREYEPKGIVVLGEIKPKLN